MFILEAMTLCSVCNWVMLNAIHPCFFPGTGRWRRAYPHFQIQKIRGKWQVGALAKWPARLVALPPRIASNSLAGVIAATFNTGLKLWEESVKYYKNSLIPPLAKGRYRNIMDMNSGLASFAAALANNSIWVMNTIAPDANENTLGVIYEHGLIGTYQNWYVILSPFI
jgi:hypothetical protein